MHWKSESLILPVPMDAKYPIACQRCSIHGYSKCHPRLVRKNLVEDVCFGKSSLLFHRASQLIFSYLFRHVWHQIEHESNKLDIYIRVWKWRIIKIWKLKLNRNSMLCPAWIFWRGSCLLGNDIVLLDLQGLLVSSAYPLGMSH